MQWLEDHDSVPAWAQPFARRLAEMGRRFAVDGDGDLTFPVSYGVGYIGRPSSSDPAFYRLVFPNFHPLPDEVAKREVLAITNRLAARKKVAKVYALGSQTHAAVEWFADPDSDPSVGLDRKIYLIEEVVAEFRFELFAPTRAADSDDIGEAIDELIRAIRSPEAVSPSQGEGDGASPDSPEGLTHPGRVGTGDLLGNTSIEGPGHRDCARSDDGDRSGISDAGSVIDEEPDSEDDRPVAGDLEIPPKGHPSVIRGRDDRPSGHPTIPSEGEDG